MTSQPTSSVWQTEFEIPSTPVTEELTSMDWDDVIVGGGLTGASIAYWLKKKFPQDRIVILDAVGAGSGASGRNAGFLTKGSFHFLQSLVDTLGENEATRYWRFTQRNLDLLWEEKLLPAETQAEGSWTHLRTHGSVSAAIQVYQKLRLPFERVGLQDSRLKGLSGFAESWLDPDERSVQPLRLIHEILKGAGSPAVHNLEVTSWQSSKTTSCLQIQTRSQKTLTCRRLFLANHWQSQKLAPTFCADIEVVENEVLLTKPWNHGLTGNHYAPELKCYFRPHESGGMLIGGFRTLPGKGIQEKVATHLAPHIQRLAQVPAHSSWIGQLCFLPGVWPRSGRLPSEKNVYALIGYNGHGLGLSFHSALTLVDSLPGALS